MNSAVGALAQPPASDAREPAVTLEGIGQAFVRNRGDAVQALQGVDLVLKAGEFFSIVGPSGCGKSSLLEIIAGLVAPSEGVARFEGRPILGGTPPGVGVVFQEDASFPWLCVRDNVAFGLRRTGVDGEEIRRRVDYAVRFMGLQEFAGAYPAQLSGGMRQRVCIARTLVMQPRLILLDEPFGALDQQTRYLMGEELLRVWRETEATVMLITHSLDEAAMLSDRIGVMSARPGRILKTLTTGWPSIRDSTIAADPSFGVLTSEIWSLLRAEAIKSMRGEPS